MVPRDRECRLDQLVLPMVPMLFGAVVIPVVGVAWRGGLVRVGGCGVGVSAHCWVLKEHVRALLVLLVFGGVGVFGVFSGVARMSLVLGWFLGLVVWCVCCLRIA